MSKPGFIWKGRPGQHSPGALRIIRVALRLLRALRFAALAILAAAPAAALAQGETPTPTPTPAVMPTVGAGAIATGLIPVAPADPSKADLWYAYFTGDVKAKGFGARADVRGTPGGFRAYYNTDVWLQEGYAWARTPAGDVGGGKSDRAFGLADDTFTGTLFSDNGVTRNPFWGAGISGETRIGYDSLTWAFRWEGLGDKNGSWEEEGRGASSDPGTKLVDGATARVTYLLYKGLITIRPGVSGSSVRVAYDDGRPGFRLNDLALDLTLTAGPLSLSGLFFLREGERRPPGALLNLAYDDARAGLVEFRAEFPTVTYRIVWSEWSYLGAEAREWLLQPAVVWTPVKWIEATIEYLARRLTEPGRLVSEGAFRLGLGLRF
jgi:hypothetical protein